MTTAKNMGMLNDINAWDTSAQLNIVHRRICFPPGNDETFCRKLECHCSSISLLMTNVRECEAALKLKEYHLYTTAILESEV